MHDISSSNKSIYLKFGANILYIFFYRLNHGRIKIFNFTILKKFGIAKKHAKKENYFQTAAILWKNNLLTLPRFIL